MTARSRRVLLTLAEASEYLSRHPKYLRRLVADGKIKFYRYPGGHLRFDRADLDAFLDACLVEVSPW